MAIGKRRSDEEKSCRGEEQQAIIFLKVGIWSELFLYSFLRLAVGLGGRSAARQLNASYFNY